MNHKYGKYSDSQFQQYKKTMHSWVHFLLIYSEQREDLLDNYFDVVQIRLAGLNELLNSSVHLVSVMNLVEAARLEFNSPEHSHHKFRKLILDAHECIDRIGEDTLHG